MKDFGRTTSRIHVPVIAAALALGGLAGCDGSAPAIDAAIPVESRASQIELRIDVVPDKPASLTVLAYRAIFSGISDREVLGLVDPLASAGVNRAAGECQLRDLDRASADLAAHGDAIELQELKGIAVASAGAEAGIGIGTPTATAELVRLSPRMFPDIAAAIGGVVAEGGPVGLPQVPPRLQVNQAPSSTESASATLSLPAPAWVKHINGVVAVSGAAIGTANDLKLALSVSGRDETSIELRPFGATVALGCSVAVSALPTVEGGASSELDLVISHQVLSGLVAAAGGAPGAPIAAALDVVRRTEAPMASPTGSHIALEVRTSTLVELRP